MYLVCRRCLRTIGIRLMDCSLRKSLPKECQFLLWTQCSNIILSRSLLPDLLFPSLQLNLYRRER